MGARQRIAVAVHRRLLLLPFNLDTAQPRQRVAGGRESLIVQLDGERQSALPRRRITVPSSRGTAASWAHRAALNSSSNKAADDRDLATPRSARLVSLG